MDLLIWNKNFYKINDSQANLKHLQNILKVDQLSMHYHKYFKIKIGFGNADKCIYCPHQIIYTLNFAKQAMEYSM